MDKSNMTFVVNGNAVSWGLASVQTRALRSAKNDPKRIKTYKDKGLIDVSPSVSSFLRKHQGIIRNGNLIHQDGSNFFGGIIGLSSISETKEFQSKVESVLRYEYGFTDEELESAEEFITDLVGLGSKEDVQKLVKDTTEYKDSIERLWKRNESRIIDFVYDVLGYRPENRGKVCTYVLYPNYDINRTSQVAKDKTFLFFGKRGESDPNKILAFMAHQAVHEPMLPYLPKMTKKQKEEYHAFIKFLTEKDVYNRLTGKSYLDIVTKDENPEIMGRIYPFWLGYRYRNSSKSGKSAFQEIANAIRRDKAYYDGLPETSKKKKIYSYYAFEKLDPAKIAKLFQERRGITPYQFAETDFSRTDLVYKEKYLRFEGQEVDI